MFRVALRGAALVLSGALAITMANAAPSVADTSVSVTLTPSHGPVGTSVDISAPSGLANVVHVAFGSSAMVDPTAPVTDTDVQVTVPSDATTGVLTLYYADNSSAPTQQSYTVQLPTTATIASRPAVTFPHLVTVRAQLRAGAAAVAHQSAHLQRRLRGTRSWHVIRNARSTDSAGRVGWELTPRDTADYRVVFSDSTGYLGTTTGHTRIHVHPFVSLTVPGVAPILTATTLSGRLRPFPAGGHVTVDRKPAGGTWQKLGTASVGPRGRFHFTETLATTGRYAYRVRRAPDARHGAGISAARSLRAVQRSLHQGMTGPDVRALQQQLVKLHYDLGGVNGSYDFDTEHAVTAFEKVQGLARDGVVGTKVWQALGAPRVPHLRYPSAASVAGVEVDLAHQVVYYAVHSRIVRILDSSTGGGYYYTGSDGTTQQAITPTGHFSVVYIREGWVTSKLGTLYRPAYFNNDGYAIHGETDVPNYPASHGCVRITVPARDRLGSKLYDGLSVWIY